MTAYVEKRPKFNLNDKNPKCTECLKPFKDHTPDDETKCRKHALDSRASLQTIDYLNAGFTQARGKSIEH